MLDTLLDTTLYQETPEGTKIEQHPAGLFARGQAYLVDELLRWVIIIGGWIAGGFMGTAGMGFALIITFLTYWLFGVAFEVLNNGVTPGKKTMNLRVVHDDGTPIRLPASLVRNFLLTVDFLPMAYAAGILSLLATTPFKRIGDLAAGTMVVYNVAPKIDSRNTQQPVKQAPVVLMLDEQTTLVDYLERAPLLNEARANELALILAEVMHTTADDAREDIERIAAGYKGASQSSASGAAK